MFSKILIANRGEIACRVIRTARRMGIATVAVYSDADADARHVRLADEAVRIGPAAARESYLVADNILKAAQLTGAQAVHPGYGFLSEDDAFADSCTAAGIVFIGPPASAIRAMGSKSAAKTLMQRAEVPLTPGYHGTDQAPAFLADQARQIGYPVLIKASAGGGGKGMRRVDAPEDFDAALASCKREAISSFGNDQVLIEKYVLQPRHIEIQVFGDTHGKVVHLFERDCSVQRRHQKVLEEAPAPGMTSERRAAMGRAAVDAAKAVGYVGAGTVEFIAMQDGTFYFMEMNTRLQVEHPVTEMITGLDLVEWQLRVASGEPLPMTQEQLTITGHALEARIYAEDPDKGFLPSVGRLTTLVPPPQSDVVRVDTGVEQGDEISPFYDPMIAKLIVWGSDRTEALARMRTALASYRIIGVANNVEFLGRLVGVPSFAEARLDTGLIETEHARLFPEHRDVPGTVWLLTALAELLRQKPFINPSEPSSPWSSLGGWRQHGVASQQFELHSGEASQVIEASAVDKGWQLTIGDDTIPVSGVSTAAGELRARIGDSSVNAAVLATGTRRHVFHEGHTWLVDVLPAWKGAGGLEDQHGGLRAPMPGKVIALLAKAGAMVEKGAPLLMLEAMKMEHTIHAPGPGVVTAYNYGVGDQVADGAELLVFEAATLATAEVAT
ncbi:acetyl/propionyl/methylcrotonyl-CoA carboxylase subunit alpha [soil metagenome]